MWTSFENIGLQTSEKVSWEKKKKTCAKHKIDRSQNGRSNKPMALSIAAKSTANISEPCCAPCNLGYRWDLPAVHPTTECGATARVAASSGHCSCVQPCSSARRSTSPVIWVCINMHHVSRIYAGCYYRLCQLRRLRRSLDSNSLATLVYAVVNYSRIDYCNTVLAGAPRTVTDKLQRVLNAAARVVTGTWKFDRGLGQILHDELHWLDVPNRVFFKLAVTVHRCLNGRAPPYLSDYCVPAAGVDTRQHLYRLSRDNLTHFYLPNLSHHFKLLSHICVPCPRSYLAYATLISTSYYYYYYYYYYYCCCYYYYYYYKR